MPKVSKKPVKKTVSKSKTTKRAKKSPLNAPMRSFQVYRNDYPFMTRRITRQTLYWLVLMVVIVGFQLWILSLQIDIVNTLQSLKV